MLSKIGGVLNSEVSYFLISHLRQINILILENLKTTKNHHAKYLLKKDLFECADTRLGYEILSSPAYSLNHF